MTVLSKKKTRKLGMPTNGLKICPLLEMTTVRIFGFLRLFSTELQQNENQSKIIKHLLSSIFSVFQND